MSAPVRLPVTPDTVRPVAQGHPWVYAEGLAGPRPPAGTPVQLLDDKGKPLAFGLADDGPIAVRVLDRHGGAVPRLLAERVAAAAALRRRVVPPETDAYRLLNGEGDLLPGLVVDRYGPLLIVRVYGACWTPWLGDLIPPLMALPGVTTVARRLGVRRVDGGEGLELLAGPPAPDALVVQEAGLRFIVRPEKGQKTGLFLDQREHRLHVGRLADGAVMANLFAYTGGFSVHAAARGAKRVITVDIAGAALDDARENFRLNGIDPGAHAFVEADAFQWRPDAPVDLLVVDPPSLAHAQKADGAARAAYRDLASTTGAFVAPGGLLATASCTARLSFERWEDALREGLRKAGRFSWLWRAGEPPDHPTALAHPEGRYLKFALLHRHPAPGGGR
jgi:23S rRNA (cytosine1962-C5)-methyltransferase